MKISSKARYALASMINMAQTGSPEERVTVISLSKRLDISKIFLEQVFTMLRRSGLVTSIKGPSGGYLLARPADEISAFDILSATETALFEPTEVTVKESAPGIEGAMQTLVFAPSDHALCTMLKKVRLSDLVEEARRQSDQVGYMYYL